MLDRKIVPPIHVLVDRYLADEDSTLSRVFINGVLECYAVEDEYRVVKVKGETRIPPGKYKLAVRGVGGFNAKYQIKFPAWHKGMIQVINVPKFEYILIHIGNTDEDTEGCLCVGAERIEKDGCLSVLKSGLAYVDFYKKVIDSVIAGTATIEYQDNDKPKGT